MYIRLSNLILAEGEIEREREREGMLILIETQSRRVWIHPRPVFAYLRTLEQTRTLPGWL